ncbi:MAG: class I SAM-dependent methyltransferase [Pseudanabaena sp.]|jgi:cyclopropane fatty-acyl-phospholipid synthase-like methyltransferase
MISNNLSHQQKWDQWNQSSPPKYPHNKVIQFVLRNFPTSIRATTKVLDLGCGSGANTVFLANEGFKVFASDISSDGINNTQKQLSNMGLTAELRVESIDEISFPKEYFDLVISCGVFECAGFEPAKDAIAKIADVLKPRGKGFFLFASDVDFRVEQDNLLGLHGYSHKEIELIFHQYDWSTLFIDRYITTFQNQSLQSNDFLITVEK